ncbi:hypothetical protein CGLAUT_08640 [Corynebacterium glaucum]|nr:hypothetical protein CGLAUT_08640 [Corynebacterium glaucum]
MLTGMAVHISIDLDNATYTDLVALVDAARVAGVDPSAQLALEHTTLTIEVEASKSAPQNLAAREPARQDEEPHRPLPHLGDAAIRSVVDILTGRQEPPRR